MGHLREAELITRIRQQLPPPPDWLLVGIGDDAAVVEPVRNRVDVLTVDALVEGIHFDRRFVPPDAIGHRALAVNLSDVASMGGEPRLALLSMALPASLPLDDFDGIIGGFAALARRHKLHLVGGNLTRSPGPLMIDVTVTGRVKRRLVLTRTGAQAGDHVYVSGTIGSAAAGLQMLRERVDDPATHPDGDANELRMCTERYLRPEPRIVAGMQIGRNKLATACMDLSDGLADAVHRVSAASGVGMTIDSASLPIVSAARHWFNRQQLDAEEQALTAGDDYELLVTVRPRTTRRFERLMAKEDVPFTHIGVCTAETALVLRDDSPDGPVDRPLPAAGFGHFR